MKSQDVGLLLKLVCLQKQDTQVLRNSAEQRVRVPNEWRDWGETEEDKVLQKMQLQLTDNIELLVERYSVRALAAETGISKSQVSLSLQRMMDVGLAKRDRRLDIPRANISLLLDFLTSGLRFVFPARAGELTRGISTSFAAPVLEGKLMSAGELPMVWPDAKGNTKGLSVDPLFKSATLAIRRDPEMYAMLALVDAIRLGQPRERNLAVSMLKKRMETGL
ncbi:hypothetical protein [Oceanisphaera sp. IT1-181]|uniref:hypothetical protein n=1 Tax=Oceanisphaera sp. IT1-181 TaxID=3081199 RepID=UPI0029C9DD62|nr:hypothetical protein [Oceanisphaera sp. IT1-181]